MESTATDPTPAAGQSGQSGKSGHFQHITLATDGSTDSRAATSALGALPWEAGTTITVVGVVTVGASYGGSSLPMTGVGMDAVAFFEAGQEAAQAAMAEAVAASAAILRAAAPGITVVESVRTGGPADEILAQATEDGAGLVVAGAQGHGIVGGLVLGSVSETLMARSSRPVLIVRGGPWATPVRVLVGIGPEDEPARLGDAVLALPLARGSRVVAAAVADRDGGNGQADRLAAHLTANGQGLAVETRSLTGDVAGALLGAAAELPADLIVAGARARRGMRANLGLGSVSRALVRRAGCSVLVVRPGA